MCWQTPGLDLWLSLEAKREEEEQRESAEKHEVCGRKKGARLGSGEDRSREVRPASPKTHSAESHKDKNS